MKRILLHVTFWLFNILLYSVTSLSLEGELLIWLWLFPMLIRFSILIIETYVHLYYIFPKFFLQGKYLFYTIFLITEILFFTFLQNICEVYYDTNVLYAKDLIGIEDLPGFWEVTYGNMVASCGFILLTTLCKLSRDWSKQRKRTRQLETENLQTELNYLKSQLNPHFLFNTINLIFGHIDKNNKTARDITLKFSELLRYQLYECNTDFISIEKEINYLHNYIELQKSRRNNNLRCQLTTSGDVSGFDIAPLLMIPFLENAFKYASADDRRDNHLKVELTKSKEDFLFYCFNTKDHINGRELIKNGGLGIHNVQRRLELIYPERYELEIVNASDFFEVRLRIAIYEYDQMLYNR
jgi:two-component system, LytTR family, sensor kinase